MALTQEQTNKLTRIQRYATRYELAAVHTENGKRVLIGYTQKTRPGLFKMVEKNAVDAVRLLADGVDLIHFEKRAADGAKMGKWSIQFTGRTQRESIIAGELPFFVSALSTDKQ